MERREVSTLESVRPVALHFGRGSIGFRVEGL